MTSWNEIPFDPKADDATKADEFDRQFAENATNGLIKEATGEYRPEPGQAEREPKGKW